jgi:hypothetical protein
LEEEKQEESEKYAVRNMLHGFPPSLPRRAGSGMTRRFAKNDELSFTKENEEQGFFPPKTIGGKGMNPLGIDYYNLNPPGINAWAKLIGFDCNDSYFGGGVEAEWNK